MRLLKRREIVSIELTIEEVELIRKYMQNPQDDEDSEMALGLFVGCSRILGYDISHDGRIKK